MKNFILAILIAMLLAVCVAAHPADEFNGIVAAEMHHAEAQRAIAAYLTTHCHFYLSKKHAGQVEAECRVEEEKQ
jgi:hypothetical protein